MALIVGIVTILGQFKLKERDFEMKAAEIIMEGDNPFLTGGKAKAQTKIFSGRLTEDFASQSASADLTGGFVGVRISAWGTFWATCRVKFNKDPVPVLVHRHIDFEMPAYGSSRS